jgi:thymidine phosphorylase
LETNRLTQEIQTLKQRLQSKEESIDWRDVKISKMIQKVTEAEGNELEIEAQKALNQKLTEDFTEEFKAKHELLTQHEAVKQSSKTDRDVIQSKLERSELYNRKLRGSPQKPTQNR